MSSDQPEKPKKRKRKRGPDGPSKSAQIQLSQRLDNLAEDNDDLFDEDLENAEGQGEDRQDVAEALEQSKLAEAQRIRKKKTIFRSSGLAVFALFSYWVYTLFIPYQGVQPFGICRTFLELNVQYPDTLKLRETETFNSRIRIWFSHIDGYGQYKLQQIECMYKADDNLPYVLDSVLISNKLVNPERRELFEVDIDKVRLFNKSVMPWIINYEMDLTLPWPVPNAISELQPQTHLYRRPLF